MENKNYCILPWIHMHIWPDGTTFPCCLAKHDYQLGNTNNKSFKELWNSDKMRELRLNVLNDVPTDGCSRCYEHESNGVRSMRMNMNHQFEHFNSRTALTKEDGSLDDIFMGYMDIRFSNICNFRCRSCGPELSSNWHDDSVKLGRRNGKEKRILKVKRSLDELWDDMESWIDTVEHLYFAGGEPLIMDEHYKILEHLINIGKTDIYISYNTNLSKLKYKNKNVIDLWRHFDRIRVDASIDAMGEVGEYVRTGTVWEEIEQNARTITRELRNVEFGITPTISALNAEHAPDFFDHWVQKGIIEPDRIHVNTLLFPEYLRAQVLPRYKRKQIQKRWQKYIDDYDLENEDTQRRCLPEMQGFIRSLDTDKTELQDKFLEYISSIDKIRNEDVMQIIPSLRCLKPGPVGRIVNRIRDLL